MAEHIVTENRLNRVNGIQHKISQVVFGQEGPLIFQEIFHQLKPSLHGRVIGRVRGSAQRTVRSSSETCKYGLTETIKQQRSMTGKHTRIRKTTRCRSKNTKRNKQGPTGVR
jgi:hypothetical protein